MQWRRHRSKGARSFWGQQVLKPGHRIHFFPQKSWRPFSSRRPQSTGRQRRWLFHCQNKTDKVVRYGNIFIFSLQYYRSKAIGRAEPGRWIFPARSFDVARPGVVPPLCVCFPVQWEVWLVLLNTRYSVTIILLAAWSTDNINDWSVIEE